jgi:hypothetical protein
LPWVMPALYVVAYSVTFCLESLPGLPLLTHVAVVAQVDVRSLDVVTGN